MHGFFSRGEEGEFIWKNYMALRTYLVGINVLGECGIPGSPSSQISCFMWASFFCYITNENHVKCFQFSLFKGLRLWGIVKSPAQLKNCAQANNSWERQTSLCFPCLTHSNEGGNVRNINIFPFLLNLNSNIQISECFSLPSHSHVRS